MEAGETSAVGRRGDIHRISEKMQDGLENCASLRDQEGDNDDHLAMAIYGDAETSVLHTFFKAMLRGVVILFDCTLEADGIMLA